MSTELPGSKKVGFPWLPVILALLVGIGIGVAVDRFALPRAANPTAPELQLFEQTGSFNAGAGQGEVHFPLPYALPPYVELKYSVGPIVVVETTANGFKWRDDSIPRQGQGGTWISKGVKATKVP